MLTTTMKMPPMISVITERMYRTIEHDPQYLLAEDGARPHKTAHVIIARLYGFDEQIDHEWRIERPELVLLTPHPVSMSALMDDDPMALPRGDRYILQSGCATYSVDASMVDNETRRWIGEDPNPATFQWDFMALRYRRRA